MEEIPVNDNIIFFHSLQLKPSAPVNSNQIKPSFEIEGPFNIGDPVHEALTYNSLKSAGFLNTADNQNEFRADRNQSYWEYIRGVFWNDDPSCLFFDSSTESDNFSTGLQWYLDFHKAEELSTSGKVSEISTLTGRSHFGDLQFLHAMELKVNEDPLLTQSKILDWGIFVYKVAVGELEYLREVNDSSTGIAKYNFPSVTIQNLFNVSGHESYSKKYGRDANIIVQQRAAGSLLHLIQDSFSIAHCRRLSHGSGSMNIRKIEQFGCYSIQNHTKHSDADKMPKDQLLTEIVGICTSLLTSIKSKKPSSEYILELKEIFGLANNAVGAGHVGIPK